MFNQFNFDIIQLVIDVIFLLLMLFANA